MRMTDEATVLLVEDDPDDTQLFRHAFAKAGLDNPLVVASDGDAAVAYLDRFAASAEHGHGPPPSLVILDLKLPRRSGFEVLSHIRRQAATRHVPVVVLTSSDRHDDIERAYEAGANSYLVKPLSRDALIELVRSLDAFWLRLNQVP